MTATQQNARALLAELQRLTELRPVLEAAERGERIEARSGPGEPWCHYKEIALHLPASCYRVAPRTILVNGIEVPEPMRSPPAEGTEYWLADTDADLLAVAGDWDDTDLEHRWLARGLCHSTREAAEAHARAMMAASAREGAC